MAKSDRRRPASTNKAEQSKAVTQLMNNEIEELKDTVRYLELQMIEKKRDLEEIMKELEAANNNAQEHERNYTREVTINRMHVNKLGELEVKIKEQKDAQDDVAFRIKNKIADYQNEINLREEEIARLKARVHQKAEELKVAEIGTMAHRTKANHAVDESKANSYKVSVLESQVKELKQDLIDNNTLRKSEGTAFLEIEHLKADNDRLIKLLQSTKEYKSFSKFALDSLGSVRFMPATKKKKWAVKHWGANTIVENVPPNYEEENWIPQEAFDTAYGFKLKYGNELNDTLINKLLKTLNLVWRDRERRQIARVRNECNSEIQKLKRQIVSTAPLSEVNAKSEIQRLKTQLFDSQHKLRQNIVQKKKNLRQTEISDHVETAFKIAGDLQDERNKVLQENQILKVRLLDAEKLHKDQDFERAKFMQGAAWQATKSLNENIELKENVEVLIADFKSHERNLHLKGDSLGLQLFRQKNHEIVLEEIQDVINKSNENFKKMMEVANECYSTSQDKVNILGGTGSKINL